MTPDEAKRIVQLALQEPIGLLLRVEPREDFERVQGCLLSAMNKLNVTGALAVRQSRWEEADIMIVWKNYRLPASQRAEIMAAVKEEEMKEFGEESTSVQA